MLSRSCENNRRPTHKITIDQHTKQKKLCREQPFVPFLVSEMEKDITKTKTKQKRFSTSKGNKRGSAEARNEIQPQTYNGYRENYHNKVA